MFLQKNCTAMSQLIAMYHGKCPVHVTMEGAADERGRYGNARTRDYCHLFGKTDNIFVTAVNSAAVNSALDTSEQTAVKRKKMLSPQAIQQEYGSNKRTF